MVTPDIQPRLFRKEEAAAYCRMCIPSFDTLVEAGMLPPSLPCEEYGVKLQLWDLRALDAKLDKLSSLTNENATDSEWRNNFKEKLNARRQKCEERRKAS